MGAVISLSDAWLSADARGLRVRVRFTTASVRRHGDTAEQATATQRRVADSGADALCVEIAVPEARRALINRC